MGWVGLRHAHKTKVRPWIPSGKGKLNTLDELFDCAAASEFKLDYKTPGGQHHQTQAGESHKGGGKKRNFQPSISEPAENTSGNSNDSKITRNSNRESSISPVEAAVPTYHQRRGSQMKSTKVKRQTGKALAVAVETTKPTFVPHTESRAHKTELQQ